MRKRLYQSYQYLEHSAMTGVELLKTNFASSLLILVGWYNNLFFTQSDLIWCQMYWMLWNNCEICRNQMNLKQNARADVKYQYETFKYSSKSPATTRFIQIYVHVRSLFYTLHVSKMPNIGQIARDVSSSISILIEPSFFLVQFNHAPSVISAVWKSLRLS